MSNQPQKVVHGTGRARGRPPSQSAAQPGAGPQAPPGAGPQAGAPPAGAWGPGASGGPPPQAGGMPPGPRPPLSAQQPGGRGRAGRGAQSQMQSMQQGMPGQRPQMDVAQPQQHPPPQQQQQQQQPAQQPPPSQQQRPLGMEEAGQGPPSSLPAGRASHRGAVDARPGQEGRVLYDRMKEMSLDGGGDNGRARKRGALAIQYIEKTTKPAEMESKKGNAGQQMMMCSNMFHFQPIAESHMYQYHVDFSPDVPSKRLRTSLIRAQAAVLGETRITDGMLLFLPIHLPTEETELIGKRKLRPTETGEQGEETIKITVKFTGEVQKNTNTRLQIYNILFKRVLQHLGMTLIQRSYFNPAKAHHLDQFKVDIWPGYSTAIGLYERQIGLVADVSHKVIKTSTVYDFMKQLRGDRTLISAKLIGRIVMTRYNNKTYRVDDIDWKQNAMSSFKLRNGTEQRYMDYYKNAYSCEIHDPQQPLLMSMPKKKDVRAGQDGFICLIPELCIITGIDDDMRADFRMMQDFQKVTRVGPHERARELEQLSEEIANNPAAKKELADWNLELSGRLAEIQGRVLDKEVIKMVKGRDLVNITVDQDASWSRNMRDTKVTAPMSLEKQSWLCIFPKSAQDGVNLFMNDLFSVGRGMGMNIGEPAMVQLSFNPRQMEYLEAIKTHCDKNFKMVMVVLNSKDKSVYDAAKVELCIQRAIPSQFICKQTINREKGRKSVATKVALQMNCKLGGELWETDMPMTNAMVVGIDTYHDSAAKRRSAVGVVASLNKNLTRYYSRSFLQDENEELAKGLNSAMTACLKKYQAVNQTLPSRIFIFRDGVGDGMLSMVEDFEIRQVEEAIKALQADYKPMLSVIIVKKRMNTRIFRVDNRNRAQPRYDNPPPGTVVDDIITKPMWYDFFIVSQSVNQGTVAPTHYHVLRDASKFSVNIMQRLTYKLCHLYYNWPGTIRVPAPCQYAHKLAFLVGQSLHKPPHVELCDKLFYL